MRRAHPIVFVAMWAVVTLLAVAGFAAFQISGRPVPAATSADMGREVGALAGLGFRAGKGEEVVTAVVDEETTTTTTPAADAGPPSVDTMPTHGWLSEMQVRALVAKYFPPEDVNRAIRVIWCESRFNPTASNPQTGATGLFRHLPEFWAHRSEAAGFPGAKPSDPEPNVAAAAYAIYEEGGWDVFTCIP